MTKATELSKWKLVQSMVPFYECYRPPGSHDHGKATGYLGCMHTRTHIVIHTHTVTHVHTHTHLDIVSMVCVRSMIDFFFFLTNECAPCIHVHITIVMQTMIVLELLSRGDLRTFLKQQQPK